MIELEGIQRIRPPLAGFKILSNNEGEGETQNHKLCGKPEITDRMQALKQPKLLAHAVDPFQDIEVGKNVGFKRILENDLQFGTQPTQ